MLGCKGLNYWVTLFFHQKKKNENGEEKNCLKGEGLYWPFK